MVNKTRFYFSIIIILGILIAPAGKVFAAPAQQNLAVVTGFVQSITLETDTVTGVTIVSIDVLDSDDAIHTVRVSQETAIALGFVTLNSDGKPMINEMVLGKPVEIDPADILPTQAEEQHPVGSALATFFSDLPGIDYETIMAAHKQGMGFGMLAQTLWLTKKLEGNVEVFESLVDAKQTGDYSAFILEDGSTPQNWGQLKKAILGKHNGVGVVMPNLDHGGNGNESGQGNNGNGNNDNNGHGNGHGNGNGNGGGNGNGHGNGNK